VGKVRFKICWAVVLCCAAAAIGSEAQTVTTVASFDASMPTPVSLIQGGDGNFYGTTAPFEDGTIFKMTPADALPTTLDGVSVMMGDQPAYIEYISAMQINANAPSVPVTVTTANGTSQAVMAQVEAVRPAFFPWGTYAVATRLDHSIAVKNRTFPGTKTVPVGAETPSTATYNTASTVSVMVGNQPATVYGAALAAGYVGLYQVAIQIPASLANRDYPVVATISGAQSPLTTLITVHQ